MGNEATRDLLIIYGSMFVVFVVLFAIVVFIRQKRKELHLRRVNQLLREKHDERLEALEKRIEKLEKK